MDYIFLDNQKLNTEFEGFSVEEDRSPVSVSFSCFWWWVIRPQRADSSPQPPLPLPLPATRTAPYEGFP